MDADIISREIDRTTDRINETLQLLSGRAHEVKASAREWLAAACALMLFTAGIIAVASWVRRTRDVG